MTALVFFIEQIASGLYILLGVGVLLAGRGWLKARSAYRGTYFELERDIARYHRANALTVMVLLIEAALIVLGIQRVVAPRVRELAPTTQSIEQIASDGIFITSTPFALDAAPIDPSGVQLEEEDPSQLVRATPTLTPTPVGTILPNAPAPVGCDSEQATLQVPANGMIVFQPTTVIGTAFSENFAFYRFEISGPSTGGSFAPRGDYNIAVTERGPLGQFVPEFFTPGEYQFRIAVFDNANISQASCTITIYISEPIPTPTPIGQGISYVPSDTPPPPTATPHPG